MAKPQFSPHYRIPSARFESATPLCSNLTACEKSGEVEQTLALLADLKKQEDIVPDSYIFNIAMVACSKAGRLDDVLGILQEMREMSASSGPNLANYNIAIGSCARARWDALAVNSPASRWLLHSCTLSLALIMYCSLPQRKEFKPNTYNSAPAFARTKRVTRPGCKLLIIKCLQLEC